mmetsp:Transcript_2591/g.7796  ORF Transcript_2591/g.7796 Transcript_2591/m.7796 type:complete len:384 (+) Transcript_2591:243-1394(+)
MDSFEFVSAGKIIFGVGSSGRLGELVRKLNASKVLVVTGKGGWERFRGTFDALREHELELATFSVSREPTLEDVRDGAKHASGCDVVIGIGGGSAVDAAKAIAAVATNGGEPLEFCEVIGKGRPLENRPLPVIAMPTTAGTGSEVTKNAVVKSVQDERKVSIRSDDMIPTFAVVDPSLHVSTPRSVTAAAGMDALTQCIEPYISKKANAMVDVLSIKGIRLAAKSLRNAYRCPENVEARKDMAMAALLGGLSLANAKLGAVHGFAGVLGGMTDASHGAICAALLVPTFELNAQRVKQSWPEHYYRFEEVAAALTGNTTASVSEGIAWLKQLTSDLEISSLQKMGISEDRFDEIAEQSRKSSSMGGNPLELTNEELIIILSKAY